MKRLEADFCTKFIRWIKYRWEGNSFAWEAKVAHTDYLSFSAVSKKQKTNLLLAKKIFNYKFSDFDRMGTPFDGIYAKELDAYVVIYFSKPKNKEFFMCPIDSFLAEEHLNERKSLTEERSRDICVRQEFN